MRVLYGTALLLTFSLIVAAALLRAYSVYRSTVFKQRRKRYLGDTCSFAVFLGSGGHTAEALALVAAVDFNRYAPRKYIVSEGDTLSARKAAEVERLKATSESSSSRFEIVVIPRARRVHQSLLTTPPTAILSLVRACRTLFPIGSQPFAEVLLLNGPGTCCILCVVVYLFRFLGLPTPRLIYIESFARVNTLSLSGKLLRPFVDRFVVQWPGLLRDGRRGECCGWLI